MELELEGHPDDVHAQTARHDHLVRVPEPQIRARQRDSRLEKHEIIMKTYELLSKHMKTIL